MNLNYYKTESAIYPELIDAESSKAVVYFRKDIEKKQRTDETTGETHTYYEYLEAKVPKAEYEEYLREQMRADIDYIAAMGGMMEVLDK